MACAPREARAARVPAGLCSSPSPARGRGRPRQVGPTCRRQRRGKRELGWKKEFGPGFGRDKKRAAVWAAGKGKEKGEEGDWAGWAEKRWGEGEMFCIFFEIDSNLFNSNLNSGEFKLELNNKQWNNALRHECNTNKTTSFNFFENLPIFIFSYTKFSVKKNKR